MTKTVLVNGKSSTTSMHDTDRQGITLQHRAIRHSKFFVILTANLWSTLDHLEGMLLKDEVLVVFQNVSTPFSTFVTNVSIAHSSHVVCLVSDSTIETIHMFLMHQPQRQQLPYYNLPKSMFQCFVRGNVTESSFRTLFPWSSVREK